MLVKRLISVVDTHTGGEPTRIIVGGLPLLKGKTMMEKRNYFEENYDDIRTMVMREPRGHKDMFAAALVEPVNEDSDYGVIFLSTADYPEGYPMMCGHGTIGIATVLIELGMIEKKEPITTITLDTPGGVVKAHARVENGKLIDVRFESIPAYVLKKDVSINVPGIGEVTTDIVVSGNVFAIVPVERFGLSVEPQNTAELTRLGLFLRDEFNKAIQIEVPGRAKHLSIINQVDFSEKLADTNPPYYRNVLIFGSGSVDRSPCGTGTSAKMAALHAKGKLKEGQEFCNQSITGTVFKGTIKEVFTEDGYIKVVNSIASPAYITGFNQLIVTEDDPFGNGFQLE